MDTYFAPAARADPDQFDRQLKLIGLDPIIRELMRMVGGLLAVLNEQRQVLAVNDAFLNFLGIERSDDVLGLRPGETIQCVHAHEMPGGCGTSKYCPTCGAAIAIVTCLEKNIEDSQKCIATVERDGRTRELCLQVRACALQLGQNRSILLFIQDITAEERRAMLERAFFHDINNVVMGLVQASSLMELKLEAGQKKYLPAIKSLITRLDREILMQRALMTATCGDLQPNREVVPVNAIVEELTAMASLLCPAKMVTYEPSMDIPLSATIVTDRTLLLRVLTNMLKNAVEASEEGDTVKLMIDQNTGDMTFTIWNRKPIPENICRRIFQCHFTTKAGAGRGIGTYAMKLFGEKVLGGKVAFTSTEKEGTSFRFTVPIS